MPGIRAKRRPHNTSATGAALTTTSKDPVMSNSSGTEECTTEVQFDNDGTVVWTTGLHHHVNTGMLAFGSPNDMFNDDSSTALSTVQASGNISSASTLSPGTSDFFAHSLDFSIDDLVMGLIPTESNSPGVMPAPHRQVQLWQQGQRQQQEQQQREEVDGGEKEGEEEKQQQQTLERKHASQQITNVDNQCILFCCETISRLEYYTSANLSVLDIILSTVKCTVDKLNVLVNL